MRPAYVRVDLGEPDDQQPPSFAISPVPFLYHQGELLMPAEAKIYEVESYSALCAILKDEFQIPDAMLPPAKYFKPTKAEREDEESHIYRTVPEGAGEPEWRTKARQAIVWALDEPDWAAPEGNISVNGKHCYSLEELQHELETIAEKESEKKRIKGEAYQPDYDVLVKEVLANHPYFLFYRDLPKIRKREK